MTIPNIDPFSEIEHEISELYEQIAGATAIENEAQHAMMSRIGKSKIVKIEHIGEEETA